MMGASSVGGPLSPRLELAELKVGFSSSLAAVRVWFDGELFRARVRSPLTALRVSTHLAPAPDEESRETYCIGATGGQRRRDQRAESRQPRAAGAMRSAPVRAGNL